MKIIPASLLTVFLIFISSIFLTTSIFAASINLSEAQPSTITEFNQEYQVKVDLSINTSDGTVYYLRGVFYKSGTTNYCGYTWNGSTWYSGPVSSNEGWKNFLQVSISSSSASTVLKAKFDSDDSSCRDSGSYNFRIQRFTQGGNGTFDTQNEQLLTVNIPTPTPSITPVPTSTPNPTSVPTSVPTNVSTPTLIPEPQVTATKYVSPTVKITSVSTSAKDKSEGSVLGEISKVSVTPAEEKIAGATAKKPFPIFQILFGSGLLFIVAAAVVSVKQIKEKPKVD